MTVLEGKLLVVSVILKPHKNLNKKTKSHKTDTVTFTKHDKYTNEISVNRVMYTCSHPARCIEIQQLLGTHSSCPSYSGQNSCTMIYSFIHLFASCRPGPHSVVLTVRV